MAEKKSLVALDPGGNNNNNEDTLITCDTGANNQAYFTPADLVLGRANYAPHGFYIGADEDKGRPLNNLYGQERRGCQGFPLQAHDETDGYNYNESGGKFGFIYMTGEGAADGKALDMQYMECSNPIWAEGAATIYGSSQVLLNGRDSTYFNAAYDTAMVYPGTDYAGDGGWEQSSAHAFQFNTQGSHPSLCDLGVGNFVAQRIEWLESIGDNNIASIGLSVHVDAYNSLDDDALQADWDNGKLIGLAAETSGSSHNDSAAIVAKSQKRSFYGKGELYNAGEIKCGADLTWANSRSNIDKDFITIGRNTTEGYIRLNSVTAADKLVFQFKHDADDSGVGGDGVMSLDNNGNIIVDGDIDSDSSSDIRLKDNAKPIEDALDKLKTLSGYTFDWNDKQDFHTGSDIGIMAQEVEEVFPEIVSERKTGYKAVKYDKLVPVLIESVKTLSDTIDKLQAKIEKLEASSNRSDSF